MMAEQALQNSLDPEEIKKYRKSTRTHVTTFQYRLESILATKEDNDFTHKFISPREVNLVEAKLLESFGLFLKLPSGWVGNPLFNLLRAGHHTLPSFRADTDVVSRFPADSVMS